MKSLSSQLEKVKNLLVAREGFINEVREIIFQISGVNLATAELIWRPPTLFIRSSPSARNLVLRHRERILGRLTERFNRAAPKVIR